jgi:hypothetical protein
VSRSGAVAPRHAGPRAAWPYSRLWHSSWAARARGKVTTYTPEVESNFQTACASRADLASGSAGLSTGVLDKLKTGMEFGDFKKLDAELRRSIGVRRNRRDHDDQQARLAVRTGGPVVPGSGPAPVR